MKIRLSQILSVFVVSSFCCKTYAQSPSSKIDSLKKTLLTQKEDTNKVKTLKTLANYYWNQSDNTNSINTFLLASKLSGKIGYITGNAEALYGIAGVYQSQSDYPQAIQYYYSALRLYEQLQSKDDMKACFSSIGMENELQGNHAEALKNHNEALKLSKNLKDTQYITYSINKIADIYLAMGENDEALKNYNASLKIREKLGSKWQICQSYIKIGTVYARKKNYGKALQADSTALKIALQINDKNEIWAVAMCNGHIGEIYETQGDFYDSIGNKIMAQQMYSQTLKSYMTSLDIWKKSGGAGYIIAGVKADVGAIYTKLKQFRKARLYLDSAIAAIIKSGDKSQIKAAYQTFSSLDSAEGNYRKGYEDYKMYILYRDSIYNENNTKKTLQSDMQYEFDKKEALGKSEQDKKDAETKRIKSQQYFAIAALGFVVLAVVIIAFIQFRNNKQKQKAHNLITQQKQQVETTLTELKSTQAQLIQSAKMASLGELTSGIAHEIQNPLNFVNNFSEVNKEMIAELKDEISKGNYDEVKIIADDIEANEEKINHHGKRADAIVKGMLQHSGKSEGAKEPTGINALADEYLRLACHGLRAKDKDFNATSRTDFDNGVGKVNIISQDIGRVLLNLYNNAFYAVGEKKKSAGADYEPIVTVSTKKINTEICITVGDNGNGIPQKIIDKIFQPFFTTKPTGQGTGLGLSLSYDIIKGHNGELKVETKEGEGSAFMIYIPI